MYTQYYEEYLRKCLNELKSTENPKIQRNLKKLKQNFKEENFDRVLSPFVTILANDIIPHLHEEEIEDTLEFELQEFLKAANYARKAFVVKASLKGQENHVYRTIVIPSTLTLSQLCYIVMATFQCEGSHLFSIEVGKQTFYCAGFEENVFMSSDYVLPQFHFRKGSHMLLTYDFGENYEIDIVITETKSCYRSFTLEDVQVIDGKGYGIWEDAHYELDLFYDDRAAFNDFMEKNGYEYEWYPIDEDFDKNVLNENLIDDIYLLMTIYEYPELLEDDDEEVE